MASDPTQPDGSSADVEFELGGPFQQGGADVEAPLYTVDLYLFDTPAAATAAAGAIHATQNRTRYALGRAVVADSVGSIGPTPATLPQPTQAAIRNCLRQTGYL